MDATSPPAKPAKSILSRLATIVQWTVFSFFVLCILVQASELEKRSVPGAPVLFLYRCIVIASLLALMHLPPVFRRLPRWAKIAAYALILPSLVTFGTYSQQMKAAWERTPQGAKEAAEHAKAEQQAAAEIARQKALEDARMKAEQATAVEAAAAEKQASVEDQAKRLCDSLVSNVIALSKEGLGPEVIEINDVTVGYTGDTDRLNCSGVAVVSRGDDRGIDFGVRKTPQGKDIVTMQFR